MLFLENLFSISSTKKPQETSSNEYITASNISTEIKIEKTIQTVLEDWIRAMPFPPAFSFSPLERQQNPSFKMSFIRMENNSESSIEDFWKSQKETLTLDYKDLRRSYISTKKNYYGNKKFKT